MATFFNRFDGRGPRRGPEKRLHRINDEIRVPQVRIVGSENPENNRVMATADALSLAQAAEKDLVEIVADQVPPVCRIIEYSKFRYEQKKKEKEAKSKQHVVQMKEVRFGPNTDKHDFDFKVNHATKFLQEGNKVKAYVHFHGRSIVYKERGEKVLLEFAQALVETGKIEMLPKMEGKRMFIIVSPKLVVSKKAAGPKKEGKEKEKKEKEEKGGGAKPAENE